jgi:hypothetical protein
VKALSPATPAGNGCVIPDSSAVPVAVPEYVYSSTVNGYGAGSWDMLIITPPTYPVLLYAVTAAAGFDFASTQWQPGVNCAVKIIQAEPTTSAVLNGVNVNYMQLGAAPSAGATGGGITLEPSTQPLKWRRAYSSLTAYLVASDLNNQGTITSGQYPARIAQYQPGSARGASPNAYLSSYELLEVPLNEANMTAMNPKVRVAPAKQGVYQPAYNIGPTFEWACPRPMPSLMFDAGSVVNPFVYFPTLVSTAYQFSQQTAALHSFLVPMDPTTNRVQDSYFATNDGAGGTLPYTYGSDNTMTGVSIWRGLDKAASVTLKVVVGLEIQVSPTSPIRQFVVPAGDYEPKALQLYYDLVHDMPHTYPASSNFLQAVLGAVRTLLPSVLPHVSSIIQSARGVFGPIPPPVPVKAVSRAEQPEMRASAESRPLLLKQRRSASVASSRSGRSVKSVKSVKIKVQRPRRKRR